MGHDAEITLLTIARAIPLAVDAVELSAATGLMSRWTKELTSAGVD